MQAVSIPQFDQDLAFIGRVEIKIKNKPDHRDYRKIVAMLPGCPQGWCEDVFRLGQGVESIPVCNFYDARQNTRELRSYLVQLLTD